MRLMIVECFDCQCGLNIFYELFRTLYRTVQLAATRLETIWSRE